MEMYLTQQTLKVGCPKVWNALWLVPEDLTGEVTQHIGEPILKQQTDQLLRIQWSI